jgi:hypothetical protein
VQLTRGRAREEYGALELAVVKKVCKGPERAQREILVVLVGVEGVNVTCGRGTTSRSVRVVCEVCLSLCLSV